MPSVLQQLDATKSHTFIGPKKEINEGLDVSTFLVSQAYCDITAFIVQLNRAMFPQWGLNVNQGNSSITVFDSDSSNVKISAAVTSIANLLKNLEDMAETVQLDPGPRRFGNVAFRKWYGLLEHDALKLLERYLPASVVNFPHDSNDDALAELRAYLLGSFGSSQRLDYGTGHELSFLAFLGGIWKLHGFEPCQNGDVERSIVIGVLRPYVLSSAVDSHWLITCF